ncbi:MAG: transglycosylase domain-containing protein, partial [Gammaproteobacteria bacterium]
MNAARAGLCALLGAWLALAQAAVPTLTELRTDWHPSQAWLLDRHGEVLQATRVDFNGLRLPWVPLDEVSPAFVDALLAIEDRRFLAHGGVDWRALLAAAWQNATGGARRGASTLSMQLATLLGETGAPRGGRRSLARKWGQMRAAWALEARLDKREILEAYVNHVGFRGELRGIAAASQGLFGKAPRGLDRAESVLLATLIATPNRAPAAIAARACRLARAHALAVECGALETLAARALGAPPRLPREADDATHLARRLLHTPGERITTTLDAGLQRRVRAVLAEQLRRLDGHNVRDAAAVVLDNASGEVLAWVGAAGATSTAAQVDGVLAPRQAGSTLKPFLYGLAFERRLLTPASLLEDTPINLETSTGLYIPQNYDRDFKGVVSARTALASSLNVPAVRTLVLTGVER